MGYSDKTDLLYGELSSLKDSMMENLSTSIERQGKIQVSMERSDSLVSSSKTYKRVAHKVKLEQRKRQMMLILIAYVVVLVSLSRMFNLSS